MNPYTRSTRCSSSAVDTISVGGGQQAPNLENNQAYVSGKNILLELGGGQGNRAPLLTVYYRLGSVAVEDYLRYVKRARLTLYYRLGSVVLFKLGEGQRNSAPLLAKDDGLGGVVLEHGAGDVERTFPTTDDLL